MYCLSRLAIVGVLNSDTPRAVVREIALAHGVGYNDQFWDDYAYHQYIIRTIGETHVPAIKEPFNTQDWYKIARFVSPLTNYRIWPEFRDSDTSGVYSLREALFTYLNYHSQKSFDTSNIEIGPLTPSNVYTWDACILYRYCIIRRLTLNWKTSIKEMYDLINIDIHADLHSLRMKVIQTIACRNPTKHSLINALQILKNQNTNDSRYVINPNIVWNNGQPYCKVGEKFYLIRSDWAGSLTNVRSEMESTTLQCNSENDYNQENVSHGEVFEEEISEKDRILSKSPEIGSEYLDEKAADVSEEVIPDKFENVVIIDTEEAVDKKNSQADPIIQTRQESSGIIESELVDVPIVPYPKFSEEIEVPSLETLIREIDEIVTEVRCSMDPSFNLKNVPKTFNHKKEKRICINIYNTLRQLKVDNHAKAVIVAATSYKLDISRVKNPLKEYNNLVEFEGRVEDYLPLDEELRERILSDHVYIDGPLLHFVFNPYLPKYLYHPSAMVSLIKAYGLKFDPIQDDPYTILQSAILTKNFYPGKAKNLIHQQTPLDLDDVTDLYPWEVVSYGCQETGFFLIKYSELNKLFRIYKFFHYPKFDRGDPDIFTKSEITRLLIILNVSSYFSGETKENIALRNNLIEIIGEISEMEKYLLPEEKVFRELYLTDKGKREVLDNLLNLFFDLTMKMRGWTGSGRYPIRDAPVDNPSLVDIRVSDALSKFDIYCGEHEEVADLLLKFPLYQYRGNYVLSDKEEEGLNIRDRLNIVRIGENTTYMNSCIRFSSNWFGATHCRIMTVINKNPLFDVSVMAQIG